MTLLTAVLTHLGAEDVERGLRHLAETEPASAYVALHGGRREEFERLEAGTAIFVADPSLRGEVWSQSYTEALCRLWEDRVSGDPAIDLVLFLEFDHLVLGPFASAVRALADDTGAPFLAKGAGFRDDTNWAHVLRYRADPALNDFFSAISTRNDPGRRLGCLGSGMIFRREVLEAYCAAAARAPRAYLELMIPSTIHHLGYDVVDVDAVSPLYDAVRWHPAFSFAEVVELKRRGALFAHPFKRVDRLAAVAAA